MPYDFSPKDSKKVTARRGEVDELAGRLESRRKELQERQRELSAHAQRVAQLVADVKLMPLSDRPADQLRQLQLAAQEQTTRVTKQRELRKTIRQLRRQLQRSTPLTRSRKRQPLQLI